MSKPTAKKPKPKKPRQIVLGVIGGPGITRGNGKCTCTTHLVLAAFPKLPATLQVRLIAEVLK